MIIFSLGLVATYLLEERSNLIKEKNNEVKTSLLNMESLGNIKSISGVKIDIERIGDDYRDRVNHLRLSKDRLNEFFQILSFLRVKKIIREEDVKKVGFSFYIPDQSMKMTFNFENGEAVYTLGKKLDYDQSFYMEIKKNGQSQIAIVSDESPDPGIYQSDEEYKKSDAKYKRLEIIYLLTNKYFYDTRVFKDFHYESDKINFKKIEISTFRNKKYSLNFENQTSIPAPPRGVKYFEENWILFHQFLAKLEGKNLYYPADFSLLQEALSLFEVTDRKNRRYTLEVYKKYGNENGYFLKTSLNNIIYQLKPESGQYFFVNVQDFWSKKIIATKKEYPLTLTFFNGKKEAVKVYDKELFRVLPEDKKISEASLRTLEFKRLIEFLKTEGSMVEELHLNQSEIIKKNIIRVQFEDRNLSVILEENEAIIVDLDQKLMIHHYVGAKLPFSIKYEDYFKKLTK